MSTQLDLVEHPRIKERLPLVKGELSKLGPQCPRMVLTGNFAYAETPDPQLQQELDDVMRIFAHHNYNAVDDTASSSPLSRMSGYALQLDGDMPVDTPERVAAVLGGYKLGTGTDVFLCASVPDVLRGGASAEDEIGALVSKASAALPQLMGEHHRISLQRYAGGREADRYALFVTANDVPAARTFVQYAAARAAHKEPLTVAQLIESPAYEQVQCNSAVVRQALAAQYANALGITLASNENATTSPRIKSSKACGRKHSGHRVMVSDDDDSPTTDTDTDTDTDEEWVEEWSLPRILPSALLISPTHFARSSDVLAHGKPPNNTSTYDARESRFFVVYNDACDTSGDEEGIVMSHGLLGGSTIIRTPEAASERGWHEPKLLSAMPAHSSFVYDGDTKCVAEHVHSSTAAQDAFDRRVAWHTDTSADVAHRQMAEQYYALDDPRVRRWLQHHAPKESDGSEWPLVVEKWTFIVGQLPNESTLSASIPQLASLARLKSTPTNVPVLLSNAIVGRIHELYDSKLRSQFGLSMHDIFRNTYDADVAVNAPATIHRTSALAIEHSGEKWSDRKRRWWNNIRGVPSTPPDEDGGEFSDDDNDESYSEDRRTTLRSNHDWRLHKQLYCDGEKYGISAATGTYVPQLAGGNTEQLSGTCPHEIGDPAHEECVEKRWLEMQKHVMQPHAPTVLMLDKNIICALTRD